MRASPKLPGGFLKGPHFYAVVGNTLQLFRIYKTPSQKAHYYDPQLTHEETYASIISSLFRAPFEHTLEGLELGHLSGKPRVVSPDAASQPTGPLRLVSHLAIPTSGLGGGRQERWKGPG